MKIKSILVVPILFLCCFFLLSFSSFGEESLSFDILEEIIPIQLGSSYQLSLSYYDLEEYNNISWRSSDESIVTVSNEGLLSALAVGEASIYLEDENGDPLPDTCLIKVMDSVDKIWGQIGGQRYLFTDDEALTGWQTIEDEWYYLNAEGVMTTGWQYVNGKWYYLDVDGVMTTGWQSVNEKWYYMNSSGAMQTGWLSIDGKWYFLNPSGDMAYGWLKRGKTWYYLGDDGIMQTGWQKVNEKWYFMNSSGAMLTGWIKPRGSWYYLNSSGAMETGWVKWRGSWYYLSLDSGRMYCSGWRWIGNVDYKFSSSGAMVGAWMDVPCYYQNPELPTGCESVALTNALRFYGFNLSKCTIADQYLSWSGSDYITAFMGNPHSGDGGMVCAPGIVLAADKYLKSQNSSLRAHNWTGASFWTICQGGPANGKPVIIWTSIGNASGGYIYCTYKYDGHNYSSIQGTHTVVLCGYDEEENVVWLADSISGKVKLSYPSVRDNYNYHNAQAVLIY